MADNRGPRIFLADLLPEHFEELVFLVGERQEALHSALYFHWNLFPLQERIAAHFDGLLIGGERARLFLGAALGDAEFAKVFAAARVLLAFEEEGATSAVLAALEKAEEPGQTAGLVQALGQCSLDKVRDTLQTWLASGPPALAVAAAEILAYHRKLDPRSQRLTELLNDADPLVRQAAWRVAALAA